MVFNSKDGEGSTNGLDLVFECLLAVKKHANLKLKEPRFLT